MSNLTQRILVAVLLLPFVLWLFVLGGWPLRGLLMVAAFISFWEYGEVTARSDKVARAALLLVGCAATGHALAAQGNDFATLLVFNLAVIALGSVFVLRPGELQSAWPRLATLGFGVIYVGLGLWAVARLRDMGDALEGAARAGPIMAAFTATWANDTCAYFAGRFFGKHKMAAQISPKKTWEGFAGGALGSLGFLFAGKAVFPEVFSFFTAVDLVCIALPTAFLGPMGDLAESMWKRGYDTKDSGAILPGHGGMLDRIDAVLFVVPWSLFYLGTVKPSIDRLLGG